MVYAVSLLPTYLLVDMSFFHLLAIVNKMAMNINMDMFYGTLIENLWGKYLAVELISFGGEVFPLNYLF